MEQLWEYEPNENDRLSELAGKDKTIAYTKAGMAIDLIKRVPLKSGDVVMEPCRGDGAFYNNFPDFVRKEYCEIKEGLDYLDWEGEVDYTLSNPPFVPRKLFWEFNRKAMDTTGVAIYWLISVLSFNVFTPKRLDEMREKGWYIKSMHITADKRWYGRYAWIRIDREDAGVITWDGVVY